MACLLRFPPVGMQISPEDEQGVLKPGETEIDAMTNDERDILEIFKNELDFIEKRRIRTIGTYAMARQIYVSGFPVMH